MPGTYAKLVTVSTGQTITASERNNEHDNHINNATPTGVDDDSSNVSAMQSTTDPYPAGAESLATDLRGEIRRLRYVVAQLSGRTNWYQDPLFAQLFQARLTLTTTVPVTTADVTAATTVYLAPYKGNIITLYDGTSWKPYSLSEISIAVPATTSTNYDIFVYDNAGTLTLEAVAWTNATTRATALALQNGVYVKSGATGRRYAGSFRTTSVSGQTEDSRSVRFLWNYYNRVSRHMYVTEATNSWTYTTDTNRQANASTANQLGALIGVAEDEVSVEVSGIVSNSTNGIRANVGIGLDSTTVDSSTIRHEATAAVVGERFPVRAVYRGIGTLGFNLWVWLERSAATGTATWYGDNGGANLQSGIFADLYA